MESKEYNLNIQEACEYLNRIVPYTRYSNGKVSYDKNSEFFVDTLYLKELVSNGKLDAQKSGRSIMFCIKDLEDLQKERLDKLKEIQEETERRNKKIDKICSITIILIFLFTIIGIFISILA